MFEAQKKKKLKNERKKYREGNFHTRLILLILKLSSLYQQFHAQLICLL